MAWLGMAAVRVVVVVAGVAGVGWVGEVGVEVGVGVWRAAAQTTPPAVVVLGWALWGAVGPSPGAWLA